ncbi:MAG: hypothetical protein HZB35_12165 [Nitrospirae bacterium]|jgi:hypothetical protein|nr:hypothetical protein [Nitrospirota bacterium]
MKSSIPHLVVGVVIFIGLVGCPARWQRLTYNDPIGQQEAQILVPGHSTIEDTVHHFGAPDAIEGTAEGLLLRYQFLDFKYFSANYFWGLRFLVPFFSPDFSMGGGGIVPDEFQVILSPDGLVKRWSFSRHETVADYKVWPFDPRPPEPESSVAF